MNNYVKKFIVYFLITELLFCLFFFLPSMIYHTNNTPQVYSLNKLVSIIIITTLLVVNYKFIKEIDIRQIPKQLLLISGVILFGTVFLIKPVVSTDLISYISRARIVSHHNSNPYILPYTEFEHDPIFDKLTTDWSHVTASLGPFYAIVGSFITTITGENVLLAVYIFKFANLISFVITAYMIYLLTKHITAVLLFVTNPFLIFELIVNSHYDAVMIMFLLISFMFLSRSIRYRNLTLGAVFLSMSFLTKLFSLMFVPFILVYIYYSSKDIKIKLKSLFIFSLITLISSAIIYFPFWEGLNTLYRYFDMGRAIALNASLFVLIFWFASKVVDLNSYHALVLGGFIGKVLFVIFYIGILYCFVFKMRKSTFRGLILTLVLVSIAFFGFSLNWFLPWYLSLLLVLLVLYQGLTDQNDKIIKLFYGVAAFGMLNYVL